MRRTCHGFSLVEVVLSLGVVSFALLTVVALLPIGLNLNHISDQETRAACILTTLESDLRNTYPSANGGKSYYFGLALPYGMGAGGRVTLNSALTAGTLSSAYSVGLDADEQAHTLSTVPALPFQASVIYLRVPGAGTPTLQIEARLIVNWPCRNTTNPVDLTSKTKVAGFVESYVSFPAP